MSRLTRTLGRCVTQLIPAGRRDWVEAVWAETPAVPPGPERLGWRAGAVRLVAREALMRRTIGSAMLFAIAAAAATWAAWPGSSASGAVVERVYVITMMALLAGLPLLARPFFGPVSNSWVARLLRVGFWAAFLALIPAQTAIDQFYNTRPRGGADLLIYGLVHPTGHSRPQWSGEVLILVIMGLYAAGILWVTSRRSRVAPATLAAGLGAGLALGIVMYAVAPLGLSQEASNPWLPGSDIDPLMLLAWLIALFGPVTAATVTDRRYASSGSLPVQAGDRIRQIVAAGLVTSLTGALFVAVLGTNTIALMLKAAWLRDWLYHGQHLLYGVQNLSADLTALPVVTYAHQLTGATDANALYAVCLLFPLIGLLPTVMVALIAWDSTATGGDSPRPGYGGPPGPEPAPALPVSGVMGASHGPRSYCGAQP